MWQTVLRQKLFSPSQVEVPGIPLSIKMSLNFLKIWSNLESWVHVVFQKFIYFVKMRTPILSEMKGKPEKTWDFTNGGGRLPARFE